MKTCSKCKTAKALTEFGKQAQSLDGYAYWCKSCRKAHGLKYSLNLSEEQKEHKRKYAKEYRKNNPDLIREGNRNYRDKYREKVRKYAREYYLRNKEQLDGYSRKWKKKNREKALEYQRKSNTRRKNQPEIRLEQFMRNGIRLSLETGTNGMWRNFVNYSIKELKVHLEKQFEPEMSWENYGRNGWHIDHTIPITAFNIRSLRDIDFQRCWALDNLRPMWESANISKGNKLKKPFQPSLNLRI